MAERSSQANRLQRVIDAALLVVVAVSLLLILAELGTSVAAELQQGAAGTPLVPAHTATPVVVQPTPPPTPRPGVTPAGPTPDPGGMPGGGEG